jgi:hypothetical protein
VAERVRVREIDDDGGRRLVRIIRRGCGSVVAPAEQMRADLERRAMAIRTQRAAITVPPADDDIVEAEIVD